MKPFDIPVIFEFISALYPRETAFRNADETTVRVWSRMLEEYNLEDVEVALQRHAASSPFPPSISELRGAITPAVMGADEAWGHVSKALRTYGYYRASEAKANTPPAVWEAVQRMGGFNAICSTDNIDVIRGQFIRLWDITAKRQHEKDLLPPSTLRALERIGALTDPDRALSVGANELRVVK